MTQRERRFATVAVLRRVRTAWWLVGALLLVTLYFSSSGSSYQLLNYDTVLLACLGAIALQVLQGTGGLVSIGNSAFLIAGSFGAVAVERMGAPFPIDIIGAIVTCGVAGFLVGLPALRLRSLFLALSTLAAFYLAVFVGTEYENNVPGAQAIGFHVHVFFSSGSLLAQQRDWAWLLLPVVALVMLGADRLMKERSGRAFRMIRDHEHISPMLGIAVQKYKLILFTTSSMVIGLQAGLLAHFTGIVEVGNFPLNLAIQYIAMIVIGGLDSLAGAVVGAALVIALPIWIPSVIGQFFSGHNAAIYDSNATVIVYGVLIVIFVTVSPDGLVGIVKKLGTLGARLVGRVVARRGGRSQGDATASPPLADTR